MRNVILIGGDLVPTPSNMIAFDSGDIHNIIDINLLDILQAADFRIFNLETPITDKLSPISKEGPIHGVPEKSIKGIKKLNPNLFTLSNNHILDQNEQGLIRTIELLDKNNIDYVGAAKNIDEASEPYIITFDNYKIGIYACTEHEYSLATGNTWGANPFDPLNSLDHINKLSQETDFTIVLYHGGKEFYRYPTPYLQKVCRRIVDKGADLVICQHSHCIGTYEDYGRGKIIYGQGNFLFDRDDKINYEVKQTSLLIKLEFGEENNVKYEFIPIRKRKEKIEMAVDEDREKILSDFENRHKEIMGPGFIENKFDELVLRNGARYLFRLSKLGLIINALDLRLFKGYLLRRQFGKLFTVRQLHSIENIIQCEVHSESVLRYIKLENDRKK